MSTNEDFLRVIRKSLKVPAEIPFLNLSASATVARAVVKVLNDDNEKKASPYWSLPLVTLAARSEAADLALRETPYGLLQMINHYNHNPRLEEYSGFNVTIDSVVCYVTKVVASRDYLRSVYEGCPIQGSLRLFRSQPLDLHKADGRTEFARLIVGLSRYIIESDAGRYRCVYLSSLW